MKSAFNSKNFIKIGSEMSSGDFVFFKDVFIWIKSEIFMCHFWPHTVLLLHLMHDKLVSFCYSRKWLNRLSWITHIFSCYTCLIYNGLDVVVIKGFLIFITDHTKNNGDLIVYTLIKFNSSLCRTIQFRGIFYMI